MSDQHLIGTEGDDLLETAEGNDWLEGLGGNDTLTGNAGNDLLDGGSGQDLMSGGAGDDSYFVDDVGDVVLEDLAEGIDTVYSSVNRVLGANLEHLILLGSAQYGIGNELSNMIAGNDSYNDLEGGGGADSLYGYGGDDYLVGGEGDDHIDGGSGSDQMYGGAGDDLYIVDDATDWILENDGEGVDTVQSSATTFQLVEHIENLTLVGAAASATGNDSANIITGNDENNVIAGRGGDDTLIGGGGNDYIADFGDGNDLLDGGSGSDFLIGEGGDDVFLPGLGGQDTVHDSGGDDEVRMGAGVTPDQVERIRQDGSSHLILRIAGTADQVTLYNWFMDPAFQVERVVFDDGTVWTPAETGALRYFGTAGDDFLQGTGWDERIEGRGGNDQFAGWGGNDVYVLGDLGFDAVFDFAGDDEVRMPAGISPDQVERIRLDGQDNLLLRVAGQQLTLFNWFFDPGNQIERVVFDDGTVWTPAETGALRYFGTAGDDFLQGTGWDERIEGRGGNDQFAGWGGNDVYVLGDLGFDAVFDFAGDDEVRMPAGISPDQVERIRLDGQDNLLLRVAGQQLTLFNWFFDPGNQIERVVFDDGTVWTPAETGALRYFGTAGDDFLQGTGWDERIEGRGGNDQFAGWGGNDVYVLGDLGFDAVFDFAGDDEVRMPAGISPDQVERIRLDGQDNLLLRVAGQQLTLFNWFFDPGNQIERVVFDDGTVWTPAETGALRYFGTAGDDFLQGTGWDERIEGRGGNDQFAGWGGNDVYVLGDLGFDAVFDFAGDDEVRMPAGISPDQVERIRLDGQDNLLLRVAGQQLTLFNWFFDPGNQIERVVFDDGTVWTPAETGALRYLGTAGDDFLQGSQYGELLEGRDGFDLLDGAGGDDVLLGGAGSDTLHGMDGNDYLDGGTAGDSLFGGRGSDTYFFDRSSGNDWILELVAPEDDLGDVDRIVFGADILPTDLVVSLDSLGRFLVTISGSPASILFNEWFNTEISTRVERFEFQNGAVLTDDELEALLPDAPIVANPIADQISQEDVAFSFTVPADTFSDPDLGDVLAYAASLADGGALPAWLAFDPATRTFSGMHPDGSAGELTIRVTATDGDGLNASDDFVLSLVAERTFSGTEGDDMLTGTVGQDVIFGLGGHDFLFGVEGHDRLYGGDGSDWMVAHTGNDLLDGGGGRDDLFGGPGSDTYVFARGPGMDIAWELAAGDPGDIDTVAVASDIAPGDISVTYVPTSHPAWNDGGFILRISGTDESFKIIWSPTSAPEHEIEQVVFADGTVWDENVLAAKAIQNGTAPTLVAPLTDQSATEDAPFSFTVPAGAFDDADIFIGDSLAFGATLADGSALPSWLSFDAGTRTFSGTPANGDVGTISVRLTATDESGRSVADEFDFTVTNTNDAPTLASPIADQGARDTVAFSFTLPADAFVDVDAGDALAYSTNALPGWLSFNPATRTFSGTPGVADIGTNVNVELRATDSGGLWVSDAFAIAVGAAPDRTITGTADNDTLNGGSGNDTIDGLGGADSMSGGLGNDAYFVNHSGDQVIEAAGGGVDTVNSSITYTLGANLENLTLTGTANRNATGNALDNVLAGNSGTNTLTGLAGNDTYIVTQSNDNVVESSGNGTDTVRASISYTLGNNVEKLVLTGSGSINGTGNSLANALTGNAGNNTLRGQGGADFLSGGAGNDILTGGSGTDEFYFGEAPGTGGVDHITDFSSGERLQFEEFVFTGLGAPGNFAPNDARFFAAPGASGGADASDRVVYNTTNGHLYYDADGSGAGAAALIAILDNEFLLSATNIGVL